MRPLVSHALTGEGPAVLLLHGLGGDHAQALGLLPDTVPATRIAPDMPGHGDTDLLDDEPANFAAFADLAAAVLDSLHRERGLPAGPVPVVGVSMGAGIALALAARRPDLCRQLVLIRPAWLDECPPPNLSAFPVIAGYLDRLGAQVGEQAFRGTQQYLALAETAPAMAGSLLGQFTRPHAARRARVLREMPGSLPLPDRAAYHAVDLDALVIAAAADPVHPEELALRLCDWLPNGRLEYVPAKMPDPTEHNLAVQQAVAGALAAPATGSGG